MADFDFFDSIQKANAGLEPEKTNTAAASASDYGLKPDGTRKDIGYFGEAKKTQQFKLNDDLTKEYINSILDNYAHLNFVDRIRNPENYPKGLELTQGSVSAHKMTTFNVDGQHLIAPRIIYDKENNSLMDLKDPNATIEHALKNGEYIPFNSKEDALWFSKNYKKMNENTDTKGTWD
jgi:hypothetical protein